VVANFRQFIDTRAAQKFYARSRQRARRTRMMQPRRFLRPASPDPGYFRQLDERIRYAIKRAIIVDLLLAGGDNQFTQVVPRLGAASALPSAT